MAELVDAPGLGSGAKSVGVRVPLAAPPLFDKHIIERTDVPRQVVEPLRRVTRRLPERVSRWPKRSERSAAIAFN